MKGSYDDILSRIAEPPDWFDENGVPRWGAFQVGRQADLHADEVGLLSVRCRCCQTKFTVCVSMNGNDPAPESLVDIIDAGSCPYTYPPNTGHCKDGPAMWSELVNVLELWIRVRPSPVYKQIVGKQLTA